MSQADEVNGGWEVPQISGCNGVAVPDQGRVVSSG